MAARVIRVSISRARLVLLRPIFPRDFFNLAGTRSRSFAVFWLIIQRTMKNYHGTPEIATVYDAVAHTSFLVSLITHVCTMVLFVVVIVVRRSLTMQRMHISRSCKVSHMLLSLFLSLPPSLPLFLYNPLYSCVPACFKVTSPLLLDWYARIIRNVVTGGGGAFRVSKWKTIVIQRRVHASLTVTYRRPVWHAKNLSIPVPGEHQRK